MTVDMNAKKAQKECRERGDNNCVVWYWLGDVGRMKLKLKDDEIETMRLRNDMTDLNKRKWVLFYL